MRDFFVHNALYWLEEFHFDGLSQSDSAHAGDRQRLAGLRIGSGNQVELDPGGYDEKRSLAKIENIYTNLKKVFEISRKEGIPTHEAAVRLAEQRLAAGRAARA